MVHKQRPSFFIAYFLFENDVKMYGTQAQIWCNSYKSRFENDVKMYGTQAVGIVVDDSVQFENDVKMYGTQANI